MGTRTDGHVWGLREYVDRWLLERWERQTSCETFAAVQIPVFVSGDCVDSGYPDNRIDYELLARFGDMAVWRVTRLAVTKIEPGLILGTECGVYNVSEQDWDLDPFSESVSWGCDPLCEASSQYVSGAHNLIFLTIRPRPMPGIIDDAGWEYVVAIRQAPSDLDNRYYLPFLLDAHNPGSWLLCNEVPEDSTTFHPLAQVGGMPFKKDKLI